MNTPDEKPTPFSDKDPIQAAREEIVEPNVIPAAEVDAGFGERAGDRIDRYKLLQEIGEGGFGVVWLAEQTEPVKRKVALKVIKLGMDTRQVVARFEAERQALALMDHPNIARVIDGGTTERGRPYFVMELVKGVPIVEYCDRSNLPISERLELMAQVCRAVQHAHGKGIIHRDLKPSNILVGTQDGRPEVKVIDFGIAKATSQTLTDKTLFTEHRQVIGTLQYMSPEQAEGSLDIDTRTDVYSLGILLYELLTGSTPFDLKTLRDAMYGEIQRLIREVDPPKPSTRLNESAAAIASIAAHRRVEPRRLGVLLRGDLDWIVMKALEKDRSRRYETANGLAMDLQRYLSGEAVVAAPPGMAYRMRKFVRRHRVTVTAGVAVAAALLVGVVGFAWQAHRARVERDAAVVARLAEAAFVELLEDCPRFLGEDDPSTIIATNSYAVLLLGQDRFADAEPYIRQALETGRRVEGEDAPNTIITQYNLTAVARELGRLEEAESLGHDTIERFARVFGPTHPNLATARSGYAKTLIALDRQEEAEPELVEAIAIVKSAMGETNPGFTRHALILTRLLVDTGRASEAEAMLREVVEVNAQARGLDDGQTASARVELGHCLTALGRFAEAEPELLESHPVLVERRRAGHKSIRRAEECLAELYTSWNAAEADPGRAAKAIEWSARVQGAREAGDR